MTKSSKIIRLVCSGAAVAAGLITATSPSHAVDVKVIPGTTCQPVNSGTTGLSAAFFTALFNASGQTRTVNCPLLRDIHNNNLGLADLDVVTQAGGAGSGTNVITCQAVSVSSQSGLLRSVIGTSPAGGGVIDFQALLGFTFFPPPGQSANGSENSVGTGTASRGSTYAVSCTLNAGDIIQAIRYDEN